MNLYTLDRKFLKKDVIDTFVSAIWTERYTEAGDAKLTVADTPENRAMLPEGTFLACEGTKEVMMLDTVTSEKGVLVAEGPSLTKFLDERIFRIYGNQGVQSYPPFLGTVGYAMTAIVEDNLVNTPTSVGQDVAREVLTGLTIGTRVNDGANYTLAIPYGPMYEVLKNLAALDSMGFNMVLESADDNAYSLKFNLYRGRDLTSAQSTYEPVQFSPALDSLANVKELKSVTGYKNIAYAYATNTENPANRTYVGFASMDGAETATNFARRSMLVMESDIQYDRETDQPPAAQIKQILDQRAANALANNNYTRVLDGEVVPQSEFKYGQHYKLGDILELLGYSGAPQKARVTEYIRAQDNSGERAYPTVSVI